MNATVNWGIKFISIYSNSDNQLKLRARMVGIEGGGWQGRLFKNNSQETEKADVPRGPLPVY